MAAPNIYPTIRRMMMKKYAAIAIITTAAATGSAQAAGFQPWAEDGAVSKRDVEQAVVPVGPFYRDGLPRAQAGGSAAKNQANVVIQPWYAAGRV
jgi:hypothetical protein